MTVALWNEGTRNLIYNVEWIRQTCESGRAVIVLNVTGMGGIELDRLVHGLHPLEPYGALHKLTNDLIWLGDSVAALRTYDVLLVLDMIENWPGISADDIRFFCRGRYDVYPRLAAVLDKRIKHIHSVDGMTSYGDWISSRYYEEFDMSGFVLPGILKYCDLPDLDQWRQVNIEL